MTWGFGGLDKFTVGLFRGLRLNMPQGAGNVKMITIGNEEACKELWS